MLRIPMHKDWHMSEYLKPLNEAAKLSGNCVILTNSGFVCSEGKIASANTSKSKPKIHITQPGEPFAPTESVRFTVIPDKSRHDILEILKEPELSTAPVYKVRIPKALFWLQDLSNFGIMFGLYPASAVVAVIITVVAVLSYISPVTRGVESLKNYIAASAVISQEFYGRKDEEPEISPETEDRFKELKEKSERFFK